MGAPNEEDEACHNRRNHKQRPIRRFLIRIAAHITSLSRELFLGFLDCAFERVVILGGESLVNVHSLGAHRGQSGRRRLVPRPIVSVKDVEGNTPLNLAKKFGHIEVVELLENAAKAGKSHAGRITKKKSDQGPPQVGG
jgi:ankyrin repeat protein